MSLLRASYLLAGLAVAAAFLLGAGCDWGQMSAVVAALTLADALLGVLGLVLAAMTGAAGVLIAADVRADIAAARAWHDIHANAVVIATPAETAPIDRVDALYVTRPQNEDLRRILLAHRFMVPVSLNGTESLAPELVDTRAGPAGSAIKPETQAVRIVSGVDGLGETLAAPAPAQLKLGPQLISSNAMIAGGRKGHNTIRMASAAKRVANAGSRWDSPVFASAATSRMPGSDFGYHGIVLADRNCRGENSAPADTTPEPDTTAQPCCRGPPVGTGRRHVAGASAPFGQAFRETEHSRAKPTAELVLLDNLGDRVPICEAELAVLEAYLEDVLHDVLGSADTATKPT